MTYAAVSEQIAKLDAISRTRALDDRESRTLARLITVERRYNRRPRASREPPAPRSGCPAAVVKGVRPPASSIVDRIDATLVRMAAEGMDVRAIYLTAEDHATLCRVRSPEIAADRFRGHIVRTDPSRRLSLIYSTRGVARAVRKSVVRPS